MFVLSILLLGGTGLGQRGNPNEEAALSPDQREYRRQQEQRANESRSAQELRQLEQNRNASIRLLATKREKPYTQEELAKIKALLEPNEADAAKYKNFLRQPKTGLSRLFTDFGCEEKNIIRVDAECADYIPGSWALSFRKKDYSDSYFYDLKFKQGNLLSGSVLSLGILTALGDVPLENVTLTGEGVKFLAELKPETEQEAAAKQMSGFVKGTESGGYKYSGKIRVEENMTYGLRVVAYRMPQNVRLLLAFDEKTPVDNGFFSFPLNDFDERDDITVAFRVVRKETDNITILWKELSRKDAPKLIFPKGVKKAVVKSKDASD